MEGGNLKTLEFYYNYKRIWHHSWFHDFIYKKINGKKYFFLLLSLRMNKSTQFSNLSLPEQVQTILSSLRDLQVL
jgi:hypothetical protein